MMALAALRQRSPSNPATLSLHACQYPVLLCRDISFCEIINIDIKI
jgi:hypothetical protein